MQNQCTVPLNELSEKLSTGPQRWYIMWVLTHDGGVS